MAGFQADLAVGSQAATPVAACIAAQPRYKVSIDLVNIDTCAAELRGEILSTGERIYERTRKGFGNACRALGQLESFLASQPHNEEVVWAAIIQAFESTFEVVWKLLQKLAANEGVTAHSPKSALAYGFQRGLWESESLCLDMLQDRNLTVHTYNAAVAERIALAVRQRYAPALRSLLDALAAEQSK